MIKTYTVPTTCLLNQQRVVYKLSKANGNRFKEPKVYFQKRGAFNSNAHVAAFSSIMILTLPTNFIMLTLSTAPDEGNTPFNLHSLTIVSKWLNDFSKRINRFYK